MTRAPLRVLRDPRGSPAHNMATDGALLRADHPATLRLYGWEPAAWSLGRFQDPAAVAPTGAWVQRETGGGAILHRDELTYALVGDAALLPADLDACYVLVHDAIASALLEFGARATRVPADHPAGPGPRALRGAHCFAEPARHDLIDPRTGRKLLGSAQRRLRTPEPRTLMHGSLPIAPRRPEEPTAAAVADLCDGPTPGWDDLADALARHLASALGREPEAADAID